MIFKNPGWNIIYYRPKCGKVGFSGWFFGSRIGSPIKNYHPQRGINVVRGARQSSTVFAYNHIDSDYNAEHSRGVENLWIPWKSPPRPLLMTTVSITRSFVPQEGGRVQGWESVFLGVLRIPLLGHKQLVSKFQRFCSFIMSSFQLSKF